MNFPGYLGQLLGCRTSGMRGVSSHLDEEKSNAPGLVRIDDRIRATAVPLILDSGPQKKDDGLITIVAEEGQKRKPKKQISEPERRFKADSGHPDKTFYSPARNFEVPADQETVVYKWGFEGDDREVSLIRTKQCDLICQVFDQATGESSRRYIGQRGAYSKKAAEEFIVNRVPDPVNTKNGPINSAVFLNTEEIPIHTWHTDLHEVRLVHSENNDKMEWIVFFINENRSERIPAGRGKDLQAYIPLWKNSVPQIELGAERTVSVLFPSIKHSEIVIELPIKQPDPNPPRTIGSVLSEIHKSLQLKDEYFDNIPARTATIGNSSITLGYYQGDRFYSAWSYAPLQDGSVPAVEGPTFGSASFEICMGAEPRMEPTKHSHLLRPPRKQGASFDGRLHYQSSKDRTGRKYFVVPANNGGVPVRHPTDPLCGNWISKQIAVKIIYDSNRCRWPGCETIDYSKHGFVPEGGGKVWWPIKNGPFDPSFDRVKDPCYPLYQQVDVKSEHLWKNAHKIGALALAFIFYKYGGGLDVTGSAMNAGEGVKMGNDVLIPFATQESRNNEEVRSKHQRDRISQKDVIEALEQQDIYNRGEDIVKAVLQGDLNQVQKLLRKYALIPSELRDFSVKLAAKHGHLQIL